MSSSLGTPRTATASVAAQATELHVGQDCEIHGDQGVIKFIGQTAFAAGKWVGVELSEPNGKNDGSVQGKTYFECKPSHGVFVRPSQVKIKAATPPSKKIMTRSRSSQGSTPGSSGRNTPATGRFAPAQDPNLSVAQSRLRSPSPKNLVPSRVAAPTTPPSRQSRLATGTASATTSRLQTPASRLTVPSATRRTVGTRPTPTSAVRRPAATPARSISQPQDITEDEEPTKSPQESVPPPKSIDPFEIKADAPEQHRQDQVVPQQEYDALVVKLRILETKRAEDRDRLRDAERSKQEADHFLTIRPKLQAKMNEMATELKELRKELKDVHTEKENLDSRQIEQSETLEMMTLDKEMAEEKAEGLQFELDALKERLEEATIEMEILKEERGDLDNRELSEEEKSSLAYIQIERQNDRLREALIRLRDISNEQEADLQRKVKDLERDVDSMQEVQAQHDQMSQKLANAEVQIEDLKQQLDAALGAEDMLEQLTEKNLSLGDQLEELKGVVEDLEALQEVSNELEDGHVETEKQMQAEIDYKDMVIREQVERLRTAEEANIDYDNTIQQFRELVQNLQSDLEVLRRRTENQQTETEQLSSQSQAMMSLNHKLQTSALKAQAKTLDLELRKLDADQALENLDLIRPYLPEVFTQTESDPIKCFLLMRRVVFKSELVIAHIDQIHSIAEKLNTVVPENLIAVTEMRRKLAWLSDTAQGFLAFMSACDVDSFAKMASVYHELIGTERRLDAFIELLKREEMRENESNVELQKSLAQMDHLHDTHLGTIADDSYRFMSFARGVDFGLDKVAVTFGYLKQAVALLCKDSEIVLVEGVDRFNAEFFGPMQTVITLCRSAKVISRKTIRALEDAANRGEKMRPELLARFSDTYKSLQVLLEFCQHVQSSLMAVVNEKRENKGELEIARLSQIIYNVTDAILKINELHIWDGSLKAVSDITEQIDKMSEAALDIDRLLKVQKVESPWVGRAKAIKAQADASAETEHKLLQSGEEMRGVLKEMKAKDAALQESTVKIELLEKRMEAVKKQAERIVTLEEDLAKTKKQEKTFEEAMESLQADLTSQEEETNRLKQLVAKYEKNGVVPTDAQKIDDTSALGFGSGDGSSLHVHELEHRLYILTTTLRYIRAENEHLRSRDLLNVLKVDEVILPPVTSSESSDIDESEETIPKATMIPEDRKDRMLKSVALESRTLQRDLASMSATCRVVDLKQMGVSRAVGDAGADSKAAPAEPHRPRWQSTKKLPDYQHQLQQSAMTALQKRASELADKLREFKQAKGEVSDKPAMVPVSFGRVTIPHKHIAGDITGGSIHFSKMEDIQRLRSVLV